MDKVFSIFIPSTHYILIEVLKFDMDCMWEEAVP